MEPNTSNFKPNWASPPGHTISDIMLEKGIGDFKIAVLLGLTKKQLNDLLNGSMEIDLPLARKLAIHLGGSTRFWISREAQYRDDLKRLKEQREQSLIQRLLGYLYYLLKF